MVLTAMIYSFMIACFLTLSMLHGHICMAGDFNCTLNPALDKSSGVDTSHMQIRRIIQHFMGELNVAQAS